MAELMEFQDWWFAALSHHALSFYPIIHLSFYPIIHCLFKGAFTYFYLFSCIELLILSPAMADWNHSFTQLRPKDRLVPSTTSFIQYKTKKMTARSFANILGLGIARGPPTGPRLIRSSTNKYCTARWPRVWGRKWSHQRRDKTRKIR